MHSNGGRYVCLIYSMEINLSNVVSCIVTNLVLHVRQYGSHLSGQLGLDCRSGNPNICISWSCLIPQTKWYVGASHVPGLPLTLIQIWAMISNLGRRPDTEIRKEPQKRDDVSCARIWRNLSLEEARIATVIYGHPTAYIWIWSRDTLLASPDGQVGITTSFDKSYLCTKNIKTFKNFVANHVVFV